MTANKTNVEECIFRGLCLSNLLGKKEITTSSGRLCAKSAASAMTIVFSFMSLTVGVFVHGNVMLISSNLVRSSNRKTLTSVPGTY